MESMELSSSSESSIFTRSSSAPFVVKLLGMLGRVLGRLALALAVPELGLLANDCTLFGTELLGEMCRWPFAKSGIELSAGMYEL